MRVMRMKYTSSRAVIEAAHKEDIPRLKALIAEDPLRHDVNSHDVECDLMTPLHIACDARNFPMVRFLVEEAHADLESFDKWKETPLFFAVTMGALDIVAYLVDKGANIHHQEFMGRTPVYWAASSGEAKVMDFLVERGASVNLKNNIGRSALSKAAWNGSVDCVERLLTYPGVAYSPHSLDRSGRARREQAHPTAQRLLGARGWPHRQEVRPRPRGLPRVHSSASPGGS